MTAVIQYLNYLTAAGFVVLALITLRDWLRFRIASRRYLALAIGLLAVVDVVSQVSGVQPTTVRLIGSEISLVGFMGAGYALLLFRDAMVPLKLRTKAIVGAACTAITVIVAALALVDRAPRWLAVVSVVLLFGVWMGTAGEPVFRMWLVSRDRPPVQRARLRALSLGYGGIILVLVAILVTLTAPAVNRNQVVQLGIELLTLAVIPLLYVSFAPPRWLRRLWRESEEEAFGAAIRDLLLFTPDRQTLAERSLHWAVRLVGGDGGVIVDAGGQVLARVEIDQPDLEALTGRLTGGASGVVSLSGRGDRLAIAVPLATAEGTGGLGVVSGPFTPLFGSDEVSRLEQYSASFLAALDRVRLVESLSTSERTVSELNRDLERRVAERTAQLEASNQELEAFSYTVSHDLRAPLRAVDGFARILLEEHGQQLDAEGQRYLAQISGSAEDMGRLIDGLLSFSRLSRQPMGSELVEPKAVVQLAVDQIKADLANRQVEFEIHDLPAVRSDAMLLGQVYVNLIGNAVKFTRPVFEARVEVGCKGNADPPVYYVRDNGIGFDMRYADKLFGVFQRLHRSDQYEGTGAGLAIVQRIVHRHGGKVWAESEPGKGAAFFFTLSEAADAAS